MKVILFVLSLLVVRTWALEPLQWTDGNLHTQENRPFIIRGANVGNWFLLEPWMLNLKDKSVFPDQYSLQQCFIKRFGVEKADALWEIYRNNWMTAEDFKLIHSFGFNCVRLPFHYSMVAGNQHLERAVQLAADAGLYTVLDFHGLPGGSNAGPQCGRQDQNKLWTDADCRKEAVRLWKQVAARFRDNNAVIAYELLNEPYGDFVNNYVGRLLETAGLLYDAVRSEDPDKLIYLPGGLNGIAFYGNPKERGWKRVGFVDHFYPGLFGYAPATLHGYARFNADVIADRERLIKEWNIPFFVSEMNPVLEWVGGPYMMRKMFDRYNAQGWGVTMWSTKKLSKGGTRSSNWELITNAESVRFDPLNDSYETIEKFFKSLPTMRRAVDTELRSAMTVEDPPEIILPQVEELLHVPDETPPDGWRTIDIGGAEKGGFKRTKNGAILSAMGYDIFGNRDQFRFVGRAAKDADGLTMTLESMHSLREYAKAGIMLRADEVPNSAHAMLHAFPDGRIMAIWRNHKGAGTDQQSMGITGFPVQLELTRRGGKIIMACTSKDGVRIEKTMDARKEWQKGGHIGYAACAQNVELPTVVHFSSHPPQSSAGKNQLGKWMNRNHYVSQTFHELNKNAMCHFRVRVQCSNPEAVSSDPIFVMKIEQELALPNGKTKKVLLDKQSWSLHSFAAKPAILEINVPASVETLRPLFFVCDREEYKALPLEHVKITSVEFYQDAGK